MSSDRTAGACHLGGTRGYILGCSLSATHRVTRSHGADPTERLVADTESWPGVETAPHRYSATEFRLSGREFGRVHRGGVLDVSLPKRVRNHLTASERTATHRFALDTGWATCDLHDSDALDGGLWHPRLAHY